jgi:hypothetical protein
MTNIFKSNSRFSSLLDDTIDLSKKDKNKDKVKNKVKDNVENKDDKFNSFKSPEKTASQFNKKENGLERKSEFNGKKEFKNKEQEQKKEAEEQDKRQKQEQYKLEILNINNFPELISNVKKENNQKQNASYMDILKKEQEIKDVGGDPDLVNLEPGWLLIKKDRQTGNTISKYGIGTVFYEEPNTSEEEIILDIVDTLVELHEKRTNEYIELNGYDVWEKMFKYPNWEEREAYLYEIDDVEDTSDEDDNENYDDYDDYDEYDDY